jgi:hypothetical protein
MVPFELPGPSAEARGQIGEKKILRRRLPKANRFVTQPLHPALIVSAGVLSDWTA